MYEYDTRRLVCYYVVPFYDVAPDRQAMQEGGGEADEGRQSE